MAWRTRGETDGFIDEVRRLPKEFPEKLEHLRAEEATKIGLILPFLEILGYSVCLTCRA